MVSQDVEIINRLGLHARAAAQLVKLTTQFQSKVFIKKGGQSANAKTIMDVLMLAGTQGTQITVEATGEDEQEALEATLGLIAARFNESE
jgi:phosphocarrier protein HPr